MRTLIQVEVEVEVEVGIEIEVKTPRPLTKDFNLLTDLGRRAFDMQRGVAVFPWVCWTNGSPVHQQISLTKTNFGVSVSVL